MIYLVYCYVFNIQAVFHVYSKCQSLVVAHRHAGIPYICDLNSGSQDFKFVSLMASPSHILN